MSQHPYLFNKTILKAACLGALSLGAVLASGCSTVDVTSITKADAVRMSPDPEITTPFQAVESARRYVSAHPGSDFAVGNGDSMLPLYQDRDVIVVERPILTDLKVGQTVMFLDENGRQVAHTLIVHSPRGWITKGLANDDVDPGTLRDSNYIGVVVKAYRPTGSPILAYWQSEPKNLIASNP